jgi:glycerol-3-phosphate acyltransferase PlsY
MFNGIAVVIIAYLLGSIPSAYIVTRIVTGKDIRKLGGGNAGTLNVYDEVGKAAGLVVGFFDVGKGIAAISIAFWLLDFTSIEQISTSLLFIFAAGMAAIAGHIWSAFLKFTGGNGLATTIGVMSVILTEETLIALAVSLVIVVITRNPVLSLNLSLLVVVPISTWLLGKPPIFIVFPLLVALMLIIHFLPTARHALAKAGSKEKLGAELFRHDSVKK